MVAGSALAFLHVAALSDIGNATQAAFATVLHATSEGLPYFIYSIAIKLGKVLLVLQLLLMTLNS